MLFFMILILPCSRGVHKRIVYHQMVNVNALVKELGVLCLSCIKSYCKLLLSHWEKWKSTHHCTILKISFWHVVLQSGLGSQIPAFQMRKSWGFCHALTGHLVGKVVINLPSESHMLPFHFFLIIKYGVKLVSFMEKTGFLKTNTVLGRIQNAEISICLRKLLS